MSHKITINTEINDKAAVERACRDNDWPIEITDNLVAFRGGPLARAHINLKTGSFTGDTDHHSRDAVRAFGTVYNEALWMNRIDQGGYLEERTVLADGTIRLTANVMVA